MFLRWVSVILMVLLFAPQAQAQRQIVTDHFYIYFDGGSENTARRVADVAEEVFDVLASSFDFYDSFSRIHILVHDDQDFSNGFANYYENRIEIWASPFDFPFPHTRGMYDWVKMVLTHELAHIVSMKVASKGIFNAVIVRSGQADQNPDFSLTLPWLNIVAPGWYVEGIAQLADEQIGYDGWDTHRDMLLRMAVLEDDLLSYDAMGVFSHDSIHSEMVYNQGFALLRYIRERYGAGKAEELTRHIGVLRFDPAIKKTLGISAKDLYREWAQSLRNHYGQQVYRITSARLGAQEGGDWNGSDMDQAALARTTDLVDERFEGKLLVDGGSFELYPVYSPDGNKLAYLSNEGYDFAIMSIWIMDLKTGERIDTRQRATSAISWTPDNRSIIYGRRSGAYYDVYRYDVNQKTARRLSANLRVRDPAVSPDGSTIAFVRNDDGTINLGLMAIDGTDVRYLSNNNDGTVYATPRWSPDGRRIAFSIFRGRDRDIAVVDADSPVFRRAGGRKPAEEDTLAFADVERFTALIHSDADERDPYWLPDSQGLVFSSDRGGIFNLYEYTWETGEIRRRTDVIGGAFMAGVAPDGATIVYAGYHAGNYSLYTADRATAPSERVTVTPINRDYTSILQARPLGDEYTVGGVPRRWSISSIIPIVGFSQRFIGNEFGLSSAEIGAEMTMGDILDRDRLFLSGAVGLNLLNRIDPDLRGTVFYERQLPPLLSKNRSLAPSAYGVYSRSILHNLRDRTSVFSDTSAVPLIVEFSDGTVDTVNGVQTGTETFQARDEFKFDFGIWGAGLRIPLSGRQTTLIEFSDWTYQEAFETRGPDHIQRQFFIGSQVIASIDTTIQLSGRLLDDRTFYSSRNILFLWDYQTLRPAIDSGINPSGGRNIQLWYNHISSTVTDSLVVPTEQVIDGQTIPILTDPNQFSPLIPVRSKLGVNELGIAWTEYIRMPAPRHTLTLSGIVRYRDKRFAEDDENNGFGGFYWPLRIYLGGFGSLSGYPYFTLEGSKAALWRASYTFPVIPRIHRQFLGFYLDSVYLSGFWEGGTTWNFDELTTDALRSSRFLHDIGAQLRMQLFSFYRIPMVAFAQVSFPLTDLTDFSRRNLALPAGRNIDDMRLYFGLGF